jgi:hypothetical protein
MKGEQVLMSTFKGSILCVVNIASKWGLTNGKCEEQRKGQSNLPLYGHDQSAHRPVTITPQQIIPNLPNSTTRTMDGVLRSWLFLATSLVRRNQ